MIVRSRRGEAWREIFWFCFVVYVDLVRLVVLIYINDNFVIINLGFLKYESIIVYLKFMFVFLEKGFKSF